MQFGYPGEACSGRGGEFRGGGRGLCFPARADGGGEEDAGRAEAPSEGVGLRCKGQLGGGFCEGKEFVLGGGVDGCERERGGDFDGEDGFDAGGAAEVDGAAVGFDGAADDGEAEAGAFDGLAVVFVATEEAFEDEGDVVRGDADAVVAEGEGALVPGPAAREANGQGATGVFFDGVFEEVGENLVPIETITVDRATGGWEIEVEVDLSIFEHGGEVVDGVLDATTDVEGFDVEGGADRFQAGDGEHVLDDANEALTMFFHDGEAVTGGSGVVDETVFEGFDVALDDGQGGAKRMGGVGDEVFADLFREDLFGDVVNH